MAGDNLKHWAKLGSQAAGRADCASSFCGPLLLLLLFAAASNLRVPAMLAA